MCLTTFIELLQNFVFFRLLPEPKDENIIPTGNNAGNGELATTASLLLYDLKKKRVNIKD